MQKKNSLFGREEGSGWPDATLFGGGLSSPQSALGWTGLALLLQAWPRPGSASFHVQMASMTESDLISGCIKGNRQAQAAFYHAYAGLVMGVVRRYSRNEQEAEDVFQEAFVKIYQNLKSVSQPQALPGWIKRVAVNTAINSFKKHSKHHGHADVDTASATAVELSESALERLGNEELLAAIQQLAPGYQMVFNLYAIEGYNHKEIGELLGISEGTSKSQYARAKAQLQDILAKLGIFTSSN